MPASSTARPTSGWRKQAALRRRCPIELRPLSRCQSCLLHRHIAPRLLDPRRQLDPRPACRPTGALSGRARRAASSSTSSAAGLAAWVARRAAMRQRGWSSALDPWLSSTNRSTAYNGAPRSSSRIGEQTHAVASRHETTRVPSPRVGGVFFAKPTAYRRLKTPRCTLPSSPPRKVTEDVVFFSFFFLKERGRGFQL